MGLFDELINSISGTDSSSSVEHPCRNCPSTCALAPGACSVCKPYKEKLIDAIYNVEHKDEILSRYEVVGNAANTGSVTCPYCGATSSDPSVCEYCGSKLKDGSSKIQVASAADIPNPVLDAQDIIFERYSAVAKCSSSGHGSSGGLLSSLLDMLDGTLDGDSETIGNKMSETEIAQMAALYGVTEAAYLSGLDCGTYLSKSAKATYDRQQSVRNNAGSFGAMGGQSLRTTGGHGKDPRMGGPGGPGRGPGGPGAPGGTPGPGNGRGIGGPGGGPGGPGAPGSRR